MVYEKSDGTRIPFDPNEEIGEEDDWNTPAEEL